MALCGFIYIYMYCLQRLYRPTCWIGGNRWVQQAPKFEPKPDQQPQHSLLPDGDDLPQLCWCRG